MAVHDTDVARSIEDRWPSLARRRVVRALVVPLLAGAIMLGPAWLPSSREASDITTAGGPPTANTAARPSQHTLAQVRRQFRDMIRPYSGPARPPVTEADALAETATHAQHVTQQVLGHLDVRVPGARRAAWHSVWVVSDVWYVDDVYAIGLGWTRGRPPPRPGWLRGVTMIDTTSGKDVMSAIF